MHNSSWSSDRLTFRRRTRAPLKTRCARLSAIGLAATAFCLSCAGPNGLVPSLQSIDLLRDLTPIHPDLSISVVIENPAGSQEKWEVRADGQLRQETVGGIPIVIPYLPWPVNGGMIPRTLLSAELGGDGEPLDVLILGPSIQRGEVVRARPIGLLRVIDRLERDDKILAVQPNTPLGEVTDIADLETEFPGIRETLATWYAQARPGAAIVVQGYGSRAAASRLIAEGVRSFESAIEDGSLPEWETP